MLANCRQFQTCTNPRAYPVTCKWRGAGSLVILPAEQAVAPEAAEAGIGETGGGIATAAKAGAWAGARLLEVPATAGLRRMWTRGLQALGPRAAAQPAGSGAASCQDAAEAEDRQVRRVVLPGYSSEPSLPQNCRACNACCAAGSYFTSSSARSVQIYCRTPATLSVRGEPCA